MAKQGLNGPFSPSQGDCRRGCWWRTICTTSAPIGRPGGVGASRARHLSSPRRTRPASPICSWPIRASRGCRRFCSTTGYCATCHAAATVS
eukprot:607561-Prorocentrum_minimum.AAC.3